MIMLFHEYTYQNREDAQYTCYTHSACNQTLYMWFSCCRLHVRLHSVNLYGVISVSNFEIPDASVRNFMQVVKNFMQAVKTLCKRSKTSCKRSKTSCKGSKLHASGRKPAFQNLKRSVLTHDLCLIPNLIETSNWERGCR